MPDVYANIPGRCRQCPHCNALKRPDKPAIRHATIPHEDFIRALFKFDGDIKRVMRAFDMTYNAVRTRKSWLRRRGVNIPNIPNKSGGHQTTDVAGLNKLVKELKDERESAKRRLRNPDSRDEAGDQGT